MIGNYHLNDGDDFRIARSVLSGAMTISQRQRAHDLLENRYFPPPAIGILMLFQSSPRQADF